MYPDHGNSGNSEPVRALNNDAGKSDRWRVQSTPQINGVSNTVLELNMIAKPAKRRGVFATQINTCMKISVRPTHWSTSVCSQPCHLAASRYLRSPKALTGQCITYPRTTKNRYLRTLRRTFGE